LDRDKEKPCIANKETGQLAGFFVFKGFSKLKCFAFVLILANIYSK